MAKFCHNTKTPKACSGPSTTWNPKTGLTIHKIDKGIDTGAVLHQEVYPIIFRPTLHETVVATNAETRARAPAAIVRVCREYRALTERAQPQKAGTKYTTPSFGAFLRMVANHRILYRRAYRRAKILSA